MGGRYMNKKQMKKFFRRLEGKEGCNFIEKIKGDPSSITWKCKGGNDKSFSRKILTKMKIGKEDQEIFLKQCEQNGGYCDCEILFNAEEKMMC